MNWEQVKGRWEHLAGSAEENWGKLTERDLDEISGKRERLTSKIQEICGIKRREADKQVWDWGKRVERAQRKIA